MVDEVKTCVDAKINFFEEYFSIPEDYTITRNNIELIKDAGHFLENLFRKKIKNNFYNF